MPRGKKPVGMVAALTNCGMINALWVDSDSEVKSQNGIGFWLYWLCFFHVANWTSRKLHGARFRCMGRKMRGLQSAWANASAWTVLWVRGTPSAQTRAKCVGHGSAVWAAIVQSGEQVALTTHLPRTSHAMQPRFHSRKPQWAGNARHVKGKWSKTLSS